MKRVRFATHSMGSNGLKLLNKSLQDEGINSLIIKTIGSKYKPNTNDVIINWGVPKSPMIGANCLNVNAHNACNKLQALQLMSSINKLRFTTDQEEAKTFKLCYCRTLLNSSSGRGIVVATNPSEVVPAPLYTKGISKVSGEYRVHVFKGRVIDFAQKKRIRDQENYNKYIRNYDNGWIFAREDITLPPSASQLAIDAVHALSLDFGAVDIVHSGYSNNCFVLEVNTAPGLQGSTVNSYKEAIISLL